MSGKTCAACGDGCDITKLFPKYKNPLGSCVCVCDMRGAATDADEFHSSFSHLSHGMTVSDASNQPPRQDFGSERGSLAAAFNDKQDSDR